MQHSVRSVQTTVKVPAVNLKEEKRTPESGQGLMVATLVGVGRSGGLVMPVQTGLHVSICIGERMVPSQVATGGHVRRMGPLLARKFPTRPPLHQCIQFPSRSDHLSKLAVRSRARYARLLAIKMDWASAIRATILSIPRGKVSTYALVAEASGYPGYHRQVAQVLNRHGHGLPWQRVLGSGGQIKTSRATAMDQRTLLELEGVKFKGRRVDMAACQHHFKKVDPT